MNLSIRESYDVTGWEESVYETLEGTAKLARARFPVRFKGRLEGEASSEILLAYNQDGTGRTVGLMRFTGKLDGKPGGFVFETAGSFAGHGMETRMTIVPGSGTGALQGISGTGEARAEATMTIPYTLVVSLPG